MALGVANLPGDSLATVAPDALRTSLGRYVAVLGLEQRWGMFTSAPRYLDLEAHTIVRWPDGETRRYEALLPGFAPYADELRLDAFFARSRPRGDPGRDARRYHASMCRAVADESGRKPESVQLIVVANMLQPLDVVRDTRAVAEARTLEGNPQACR